MLLHDCSMTPGRARRLRRSGWFFGRSASTRASAGGWTPTSPWATPSVWSSWRRRTRRARSRYTARCRFSAM